MSEKHTAGLTSEQVFDIAEKYGAFEFGDAQGDKRLAFAADVVAAHERIRAAAPVLLKALQGLVAVLNPEIQGSPNSPLEIARAAIALATTPEQSA